jgi:hypothetical protein
MEPVLTHHESTQSQIAAVHANAPAEQLFFTQYRLWMAGYSSRDADYWDCAFDVLLRFAARESAKLLHGEFHLFTRTLNEWASKRIRWRFSACRCLSLDEFLVLRLITASQRKDEDEEIHAATELLGREDVESLLTASRSLAKALHLSHFVLSPIERLPVIANMPWVPHSYTLQ